MDSHAELESVIGTKVVNIIDSAVQIFCFSEGYKTAKFLGTTIDNGEVSCVVRLDGQLDCEIVHPSRVKVVNPHPWGPAALAARMQLDDYLQEHAVLIMFGISKEKQDWSILPSPAEKKEGTVPMVSLIGVLEFAKYCMLQDQAETHESYDGDG